VAAEEVGRTVEAYQAFAAGYAAAQGELPEFIWEKVRIFAELTGSAGRILEIGSGPGRDADALETVGLTVERTDITPAFVELLRAKGHEARLLDPLTGELGTGYAGVWAQACLLHVDRTDLPVVLTRLTGAVRDGGALYLSLKEGDGDAWSTHGAVEQPRRFVYWREQPLREVLEASGWELAREIGHERHPAGEDWLEVFARRR